MQYMFLLQTFNTIIHFSEKTTVNSVVFKAFTALQISWSLLENFDFKSHLDA